MRNPVVSVIIPCFNQGKFIDDALESVFSQTFKDFEIIIINDGSTDDYTIEKLTNYKKPNTKVIHTENNGLSAARNTGFKLSRGKYIQFLDADDILSPEKFELQLEVFNSHPDIDVCYSGFKLFDIQSNEFKFFIEKEFLGPDPLIDFLFKWERGLSIPIHCGLFKRSIWDAKLPFNEELNAKEDWLMWCSLAAIGKRIYYLNKELAVYRLHSENMTRNISDMTYYTILAATKILDEIPPELKNEFLKETILFIKKTLELNNYPDLVAKISDLEKFKMVYKTRDYKIGHAILMPYRYFKRKILKVKYL
ncbi:MAG: glycosyltransferase [Bacteroidales bacterium]|jgi:glycosyltransferase involved in cell wall biosynthesis